MKYTFKGGIHPYEGKDYAKDQPIINVLANEEMVFPLSQHIGKPAKAIVKAKDEIKVGQLIGEMDGYVSSNIYSSVSGIVKVIEPRLTVSGNRSDCIVITNDFQDTPIEQEETNISQTKEDILQDIKNAGIVGLGGAGFPTHIKLNPPESEKIEYIIVNGAECEPYLTSDYRLMIEKSNDIISGLKIVLKMFPQAKGIIGIEDNKPEAIQKLKEEICQDDRIDVISLKTKYPQGGERTLIYALTGRKINSKMLPSDVGCIVDNVATMIAIHDAVYHHHPLIDKVITITGDAVKNPCNVRVKLGTNYQHILDEVGGLSCDVEKLISGGPMMGTALISLDIPVSKTSSALLCKASDEVAKYSPTACIHCGRCAEVCPSHIIPALAYRYALKSDREGFIHVNGEECCECGCCTYVCPAKRNMTQSFRKIKRQIAASRKK